MASAVIKEKRERKKVGDGPRTFLRRWRTFLIVNAHRLRPCASLRAKSDGQRSLLQGRETYM